MADASLELVINGKNNTDAAFKGLGENLKKVAVAVGAAALSFGAFGVKAVKDLGNLGEELSNLSKRTSISVESLSILKAAGDGAGVPLESLTGTIKKMQLNLADWSDPLSKTSGLMNELGLSFNDLRTASPEQQLFAIGNELAKIEDPIKRNTIAVGLLGKSGDELMPLFDATKTGKESMDEMRRAAEKTGQVMDESLLQKALKADEAFDLFDATMKGITLEVGAAFAPMIANLAEWFDKNHEAVSTFIQTGLQVLGDTFTWIYQNVWPPIEEMLTKLWEWWGKNKDTVLTFVNLGLNVLKDALQFLAGNLDTVILALGIFIGQTALGGIIKVAQQAMGAGGIGGVSSAIGAMGKMIANPFTLSIAIAWAGETVWKLIEAVKELKGLLNEADEAAANAEASAKKLFAAGKLSADQFSQAMAGVNKGKAMAESAKKEKAWLDQHGPIGWVQKSIGLGPTFATGGIVPQYFASGGLSRGTDTVPAMLTPGELILNKAQQKNLAGGMGGVTINLQGANFYGDDKSFAKKIGDEIANKLKLRTQYAR